MKHVTIYRPETGEIVCTYSCPNGQLPPQGPVQGDETVSLLHGKSDPDRDRVEHGKIVSKGIQSLKQFDDAQDWQKFRNARCLMLASTDYMMAPDFEMDPTEKNKIKQLRKKARDLPERVKDPRMALTELRSFWSVE